MLPTGRDSKFKGPEPGGWGHFPEYGGGSVSVDGKVVPSEGTGDQRLEYRESIIQGL